MSRIVRFDDVEVDTLRGEVIVSGRPLRLRQKTFEVLAYLIEHPGKDLSKDQIIAEVWEGRAVVDDVLVQSIKDIRRALGDPVNQPRFIRTIPKFGYRFIGNPIDAGRPGEAPSPVAFRPQRLARRRGVWIAACLALAYLIVSGITLRSYRSAQFAQQDDRIPVLIYQFQNNSEDPALDWLQDGLADMLTTGLSKSERIVVFSKRDLNADNEPRPREDMEIEVAIENARQTSARALITGSFSRIGERMRIDVQLYDATSGTITWAESAAVDKADDVFREVDRLAELVASRLLNGRRTNIARISDVLTPSLEAFRFYSMGLEEAEGLRSREAITLFERAIQIDPDFAMAYGRIGYTYAVTWNRFDEGKPYLEKAFSYSDRLTERDRLNIYAWYSIANLDFEKAISVYRQMIARSPADLEAYYRLSKLLRGEKRFDEALSTINAGLEVDPKAKNLHNALGGLLSAQGRHQEAIAAHMEYVALAPNEPNAHDSLGMSYQWAGNYGAAVQAYRRSLEIDPKFIIATIHLANTYYQMGRFKEASEFARRYIRDAETSGERARGHSTLMWINLRQKHYDAAAREARKVEEIEPRFTIFSTLVALERGHTDRALPLNEAFSEQFSPVVRGSKNSRRSELYFRGYLTLTLGATDQALDYFREALAEEPVPWDIDSFEDCLANAYLQLGMPSEAAVEFERVLSLNPNYPLAAYHYAKTLEKLGRRDDALEAYRRFIGSWADADPEVPELKDAKQIIGSR